MDKALYWIAFDCTGVPNKVASECTCNGCVFELVMVSLCTKVAKKMN